MFAPFRFTADDGRPQRRSRRPSSRTGWHYRLEDLENRTLLSGIAEISEYPVPNSNGVSAIVAGPDGNLWFTGADTGISETSTR